VLAEAYVARGDLARAEVLVFQRVQRFRVQQHRRALAVWLRIQGLVLGQQHRWAEASLVFAEALSLARAMPYPYAEARILYEEGLLQGQCGETELARERLQQAHAIFARLGAKADIEITAHSLSSLR
jgi:hypothetical protein